MRLSRPSVRPAPTLLISLALLLTACSTGGPGSSVDGGAQQSTIADSSEPSTDTGGPGGDGGPGGEGGTGGDAASTADALAPPNGTESSHTTSGGLILVTYETADSVETLVTYYQDAIRNAGLNITSTTTTADGAFWTFESGDLEGSVTLVEGGGSNDSTAVAVSILDKSV